MSHTSGNILPHFIFSTRGRRPLIGPEFRQKLFAYLGSAFAEPRQYAGFCKGLISSLSTTAQLIILKLTLLVSVPPGGVNTTLPVVAPLGTMAVMTLVASPLKRFPISLREA